MSGNLSPSLSKRTMISSSQNTCLFVCLFAYYFMGQVVGFAQGSAHARQCSTAEHTTKGQQQHLGACHKTTLSPSNFNKIASFTLTPMLFYFLGKFQTDTKVDHMGKKKQGMIGWRNLFLYSLSWRKSMVVRHAEHCISYLSCPVSISWTG